ncbi:restriction endonuclease subunit S [bacterium]|nr:restriction endonuclease subunit S [bacterium]
MSKWEWKKLGEVYDFTRGLTYSKKDEVESSSNCILRSNNIDLQTNSINLDELKYIKDEIDIPQEKYVRKNTILICMSNGSKAHLGKVAYIDKDYDFAFGGFMGLLKPKCEINGKFVHLYLCSDEYKNFIKSLSDGANINNLKFDDLRKFEIPFPPLSEQKRIVKFLDEEFSKIETLKTNAETNLKNAKELFETTLEKELNPLSRHSERSEESSADLPSGWEWKTLQDICRKIVDGTHNSPPNKAKGDYQYITAKNIKADGIDLSDVTYVSKEVHKEIFARCNPEKGDVLLIKDGATTGIAVINTLDYEFSLLSSVALIKVDKTKIYEKTLVYLLNSKAIYKQMRKKMDGAAITRLTLEKIKALQIPLPPLSVQKEIVARLDKLTENVKRLETNYKQIIANCDELKKSILKQTFQGGN